MIIFEQQLWMKEFIASTDKIIDEIFENTGSIEFRDILKSQHHGGKRLRPLIVAATSRLNCQSNDPPAHYAAVIVELLHLASLFHDDILDGTTIRRNNPTAQTQIGSSKAVLVGDYLLAELFQIAFQHVPPRAVTILLSTIKAMAKSEVLSKKVASKFSISKQEYFELIQSKTALLFSFAASIGAMVYPQNESTEQALQKFGYHLGIAYQITDDLEDMNGYLQDSDHDIKNGYYGLPVIELMAVIPPNKKPELLSLLHNPDRPNSIRLIALLNNFSIFKVTLAQIQKEIEQARLALNTIKTDDKSAVQFLADLCDYLFQKASTAIREYEKPITEERSNEKSKIIAIA